jgi:tripartite-type tricarboxylate transporter receptor subunit TctC
VLAPARTPAAIIARLQRELTNAIADREVRERFAANGIEAVGTTPEQFAAYLRDEVGKWGKVVRVAGVKGE